MKHLIAFIFLAATPLAAQQPHHPGPGRPHDPGHHDVFGRHLFPPELIMQRQSDIGLRDAQREQISSEIQKAHQAFTSAQWKIAAESEKLEKLLQTPTVDEARVLAQVDNILALEREVKRTHMGLLVRIRNVLTEEQRNRLQQLKGEHAR
jgi:Spy/CpxP family protein refolding chaperone